jgi:hypothetical protein
MTFRFVTLFEIKGCTHPVAAVRAHASLGFKALVSARSIGFDFIAKPAAGLSVGAAVTGRLTRCALGGHFQRTFRRDGGEHGQECHAQPKEGSH